MSTLDQEVLGAARRLLGTFEDITKLIVEPADFAVAALPSPLLQRFRAETDDYLGKFNAWKEPDRAKIIRKVQMALLTLIQAERAGDPMAAQYATERASLSEKLVKLEGVSALEFVEAAARASSIQI